MEKKEQERNKWRRTTGGHRGILQQLRYYSSNCSQWATSRPSEIQTLCVCLHVIWCCNFGKPHFRVKSSWRRECVLIFVHPYAKVHVHDRLSPPVMYFLNVFSGPLVFRVCTAWVYSWSVIYSLSIFTAIRGFLLTCSGLVMVSNCKRNPISKH